MNKNNDLYKNSSKSFIIISILLFLFSLKLIAQEKSNDIFPLVDNHYAINDGIKIHYVTIGDGPVLLMLHGFPDFWYTWRNQMLELSKNYKVVAVDLRGYNLSDKPEGVENYSMRLLMKDIITVVNHLELEKVTIIANDWGGAIAWQLATYYPNRVERLIACNIPHYAGIRDYLLSHPETGQYAQDFKNENAENKITAEELVNMHKNLNEAEKKIYLNAFNNSSFEGMLNYYKANYPKVSNTDSSSQKDPIPKPNPSQIKKIQCPVLIIHGMLDTALPVGMLNNTWDWIENEVTIHTLPNKGHFIQQEAPEKVSKIIKTWLLYSH